MIRADISTAPLYDSPQRFDGNPISGGPKRREKNVETVKGGKAQARVMLALVLCAALRAHVCWDEAAARYR